jgi:hypothetical protein
MTRLLVAVRVVETGPLALPVLVVNGVLPLAAVDFDEGGDVGAGAADVGALAGGMAGVELGADATAGLSGFLASSVFPSGSSA